jgi:hypothetical protein
MPYKDTITGQQSAPTSPESFDCMGRFHCEITSLLGISEDKTAQYGMTMSALAADMTVNKTLLLLQPHPHLGTKNRPDCNGGRGTCRTGLGAGLGVLRRLSVIKITESSCRHAHPEREEIRPTFRLHKRCTTGLLTG